MAEIPKNIRDLTEQKQNFIDLNRGKLESSVIKMQEELLNKFIEEILPELETKDGQILNTPKNLKLIEKLDAVYEQFNKTTQSNVVKKLGETLVGLNKPNMKYFGEVALNEVTKKKFDSVVSNTNKLMAARLGINETGEVKTGGFLDSFVTDRTLLTELKQITIKNVTGQQSLADFKKSLKDKIVGNDEVSGGFEKYYRTFAYDLYQEYDRAYGKQMATEFGMDYAIYQGGLIKDSRDFCRDHEDHVYTREEIADFGKWTYAKAKNITTFNDPGSQTGTPSYIDKFPDYDAFVHCGGFNCRHQLSWITKSAALRLRPDLAEEKPIEVKEIKQRKPKEPIKEVVIKEPIKSEPKYKDAEDLKSQVQKKHDEMLKKLQGASAKFKGTKEFKDLEYEFEGIRRFQYKTKELDAKNNTKNFEEIKKITKFNGNYEDLFGDGKVLGSSVSKDKGKITATVLTEDGYLQRTFDPKNKTVSMDEFYLSPLVPKGQGKGSQMFANQVNEFKKLGYEKLETDAGDARGMNGFYTWARMGYNIPKSDKMGYEMFKSTLKRSNDPEIKKAKSLHELMSTEKGRDFWKKEGSFFHGEFDLRDDSNSMRMLEQYINRKAK